MKKLFRRVAIVSKQKKALLCCRREAAQRGLRYDEQAPDVVLTYGGDGTLLHAERAYPGVPKLPLRASPTCKKCFDHDIAEALDHLARGAYEQGTRQKLKCKLSTGQEFNALNDIIFRNSNLARAIRFTLTIEGEQVGDVLIGDGLVFATPFGSTAYFKSITGTSFERGWGVAFNNLTKQRAPIFLDESATVKVSVIRGPADLAADNKIIKQLDEKGVFFVRLEGSAIILRLT